MRTTTQSSKKIKQIFIASLITFLPFMYFNACANDMKLCMPIKTPSLFPFRRISDGKETAPWIVLLKSYISTVPGEEGLLEKYEFSPDGLNFRGKVNRKSKWPNGENLTPCDAARGITMVLPYRPLGKKISIKPFKGQSACPGIQIIDNNTFELTFNTEINNPTGVIRESLSSGSKENRFWPTRTGKTGIEAITKYDYNYENGGIVFQVKDLKIKMTGPDNCTHPDFSNYPELTKDDLTKFVKDKTSVQQAINLQFNTSHISLKDRKELGSWLRSVFQKTPDFASIESVKSFFLPGESGFKEGITWPNEVNIKKIQNKTFKIATSIPVHKKIIEAAAKRDHVKIIFYNVPIKKADIDAQVNSALITRGRHIDLQDWLNLPFFSVFLKNAKLTLQSLTKISQKSAATIPPDDETLQIFEKNAISEWSLVPLGRRRAFAFSRENLPLKMVWNNAGEINFISSTYKK